MVTDTVLYDAVRRIGDELLELDDYVLSNPAWQYDALPSYEGVRYALLHTTLELRGLANELRGQRAARGPAQSLAQLALAQHHAAFRDFEVMLLGVDGPEYTTPPKPQEWPINLIVVHVHEVERFFFAAILNALRSDEPHALNDVEIAAMVNEPVDLPLDQLPVHAWRDYAGLHRYALKELAGLTDAQLARRSPAWEAEPWPTVGFRLLRFEAHLREHTNQLEKTLNWLARAPGEAKLLLRQLYAALAEVEGVLIGAPDLGADAIARQAARIEARVATVGTAIARIRDMRRAVHMLHAERIAELVTTTPGLVYTQLEDGQSALLYATYNARNEIVRTLLDAGMVLSLPEAVVTGQTERVQRIVQTWPPAINEFGRDGYTPLQLACYFGAEQIARVLLDAGADVHAVSRNKMRIQPIHAAVAGRNVAIVQMLIERGADVNARQQDDFTPLMAARQNEDAAIVTLLLEAGAE